MAKNTGESFTSPPPPLCDMRGVKGRKDNSMAKIWKEENVLYVPELDRHDAEEDKVDGTVEQRHDVHHLSQLKQR